MSSLRAWLILTAAPGVGARTCGRLLERFGSAQAVIDADPVRLAELGLKPAAIAAFQQPDQAWLAAVLAWAEQPQAHILTRADRRYPPLLAQIADPPPVLFVRGDASLLAEPQIAIVGSRNPTPGGREVTRDFARRLAASGLVVTSGLATGIDGEAHAGALAAGKTIAVLGTGPDRVYPSGHRDLAQCIMAHGALVSELAPGEGPRAQHFPRRNRIIAGLSLGTLVVEAALKSGSLITARQAAEQGREVFAIPGSIRNPLARGCHALIRDGAQLVEEAAEVLAALAPALRVELAAVPTSISTPMSIPVPTTVPTGAPAGESPGGGGEEAAADPDYRRLLAALGQDPVAPDELIRRTALPAAVVSSMLLVLELGGHVSSCPGGRYCRVRD